MGQVQKLAAVSLVVVLTSENLYGQAGGSSVLSSPVVVVTCLGGTIRAHPVSDVGGFLRRQCSGILGERLNTETILAAASLAAAVPGEPIPWPDHCPPRHRGPTGTERRENDGRTAKVNEKAPVFVDACLSVSTSVC